MARPSTAERLAAIHYEALTEFDSVQSALRDERLQCLQDRRFYSISGAQWEGPLWQQYENRPKFEVNKVALSVQRIFAEYRNNRITVDFLAKDGKTDALAETCDGLFRADEQDSVAEEAYDNAFEEAVGGGFGAFRLRPTYENDEDPDDDRQRIRIEPIFDADSSVFFDLEAKRQDKADARRCWVLYSMTHSAYKETYNDDPASWPKEIHQSEFDWLTPDVVYVAEHYRVEEVTETIRIFQALDGTEERYAPDELTEDVLAQLEAIGSREVRQKRLKRRRVRQYLMNGARILEDYGYIAGRAIPIVPVYGRRWFVDNVERCSGHVRLAKDAQRLANMQRSKLGEIAALSPIRKPIFTPEQIAGHQVMWSEDNIANYPYLLVNPVTAADGSTQIGGPVGYTEPPDVPPAMAALLQIVEQDMKDVLGEQPEAEKVTSNISGKAVEMIQQRLDMKTFGYMSNMAKAVRRGGEIWLGMAREIYVEQGRRMKSLGSASGEMESIELMRPMVGESGEVEYENDLSRAQLDVAVDVGPSSASRRQATVRALLNLISITTDEQTKAVLQAMAMQQLEGEGLGDLRKFFRKKLVEMGVSEPTDEEAEQMAAAMQGQQQDPNAIFLQAAAEEAQAKAAKARADVVATVADAELTQAKTVETLAKVGESGQPAAVAGAVRQGVQDAGPPPMSERESLEVEAMRLENEMRRRKVESTDTQIEQLRAERQANDSMVQASQAMQEAVAGLGQSVAVIGDAVGKMSEAVGQFADTSRANTDKAIAAISRPKRVVREKGRIARIETEE
jgi:hypothetical protein